MKAIYTRFIPCTITQPARIKARAEGVRTVTLTADGITHRDAAVSLCQKMKWGENIAGGTLPNGDHCWVFIDGLVKATNQLQGAIDPLLVAIGGVPGIEPLRRGVIEAQRKVDEAIANL